MSETIEKTWWLQLRDNPDRLLRVKLISRADGWVCLETVKPVKTDTGWAMEAFALKESEFDITWRTWKIVPTRRWMGREWTGRKPGKSGEGRVEI